MKTSKKKPLPTTIVKEIASYKYSLYGRLASRGPLVLYGSMGEEIAYVNFERESGVATLPPAQVVPPNDIVYMYFYYADFPVVLDMLRSEKDRKLIFVNANNCRISSGI